MESSASCGHMRLGAAAIADRGSGGARLVVSGEPIDFADALIEAGERLGPLLVARSSSTLEAGAEWSGAFTSYLELSPSDLPKGVAGCWASAFSVDALRRQEAVGIEPGSFGMAVLVQPELRPEAGGTATLNSDGSVDVHAVAGSPAPLLTGWSTGAHARLEPVAGWSDGGLVEIIGTDRLDEVAGALHRAHEALGATHCEWALDDGVWILQLAVHDEQKRQEPVDVGDDVDPLWLEVVRALVMAPDLLSEQLILPWGLAGLPGNAPEPPRPGQPDLEECQRLSLELTAQAWGEEAGVAVKMAEDCLAQLQGPDPNAALSMIKRLQPVDGDRASQLLGGVDGLRSQRSVHRVGMGKWEPLIAAVVLVAGERNQGTPAVPGIGAGIAARVAPGVDKTPFVARNVVLLGHPLPFAAPLLWDAAGLVTRSGSPAAHLFGSARALGVPAVCGVDIGADEDRLIAVEGAIGVVATVALSSPDG